MNTESQVKAFLDELRSQVQGEVRGDDHNRILYSTDASIYQRLPHGVFLPETVEDLEIAVSLAAREGIPLLPRGGGSSLAGQAVNEALVIDTSRHLDQVIEINREESWVRVQPGLVLDVLNLATAPFGLQFGPDPASSNRAAMGGIVSNNSTGAHSILYGMTADHVLEIDVLLSDGTPARFGPADTAELEQLAQKPGLEGDIYRRIRSITQTHAETIRRATPQHWRRCGGYNLDRFVEGVNYKVPPDPRFNLARLICGAEGTLAVITEMKLGLVPRPTGTALAIVHFEQLYEALRAVPHILEVEPSAVELLDHLALTMCREVPEYARLLDTFLAGSPNCVLITEFYGENEGELGKKINRLKQHLESRNIQATVVPAIDPSLQQNVWNVRKVGLGLLMSIKGDHKPIPFIEDAAVPVEHLADYVTRIENFCEGLGTRVAYYAHASAGCIHIRPLINTKEAAEVDKLEAISEFALELLTEYGGALSSEHGDGRARSWLNEAFFGRELYGLFKEVKAAFDPNNLLNPGNIVDGPAMTEHLRYGATYETIPVREHIDFSEDLGFARAVEMCNGAGICRKTTTGTMCPSFMVTREEEHSTRGRANALRAALSGVLPPEEFTSPRMYETLDLCIECKACKAECPSSVDMAKIKFEFLTHYYERHRVPMRTRLFAGIWRANRIGSGRLAPLVNGVLSTAPVRWGLEKTLGISQRRSLPALSAQPFTDWFHQRRRASVAASPDAPSVVLFNDTFHTYNHPEVARAASEVLEAAGFRIELPGHRCCGRPMISKGLVEEARQAARETIERLAPFAERGIPIVGLEPSCILSIRDEYFTLLPEDPRVREVAKLTYTFEEFIADKARTGDLQLNFQESNQRALLHGHCHQKALVGTGPALETLSLAGLQVEEVDSGCCGMAGSFGYEAEHYDISMAMAERRLLPAVRTCDDDTVIVAAGVSCRSQIEHGAGLRALHPAEVLRQALANG